MLLSVLITLCVLGSGASYLAMVSKRAPVFTAIASTGLWVVVGYSATSIDVAANDGTISTGVAAEPALSALAFGMSLLSIIVTLAAAKGEFVDETLQPAAQNELQP